jgi:hypothetical protein
MIGKRTILVRLGYLPPLDSFSCAVDVGLGPADLVKRRVTDQVVPYTTSPAGWTRFRR